jgi:hypothetical protein
MFLITWIYTRGSKNKNEKQNKPIQKLSIKIVERGKIDTLDT